MNRHLSSFTFVPSPPASHEMLNILTITGDGSLDISPVSDLPRHAWNPRGSFTVGTGFSSRIYSAEAHATKASEPLHPSTPAVEENLEVLRMTSRMGKSPQRPFALPESSTAGIGMGMGMGENSLGIYPAGGRPPHLRLGANTEPLDGRGGVNAISSSRAAKVMEARAVARRAFRQVRDDISMVIKRRVIKGYGIGNVSDIQLIWVSMDHQLQQQARARVYLCMIFIIFSYSKKKFSRLVPACFLSRRIRLPRCGPRQISRRTQSSSLEHGIFIRIQYS